MKLKKKSKVIIGFSIALFVLVVTSFLKIEKDDVVLKKARCSRPLADQIIVPRGEEKIVKFDFKSWDLQIPPNEIFEFKNGKINPLQKGQIEIVAKHKIVQNCSFSSSISVVNFRENSGFGFGDRPGIQ